MDDARIKTIKVMLGITGEYMDELIRAYGLEVEQYLLSAGVRADVLASPSSTGIFARGISDLWNYGSGDGKLSPYFIQRAIQLSYKTQADGGGGDSGGGGSPGNDVIPITTEEIDKILREECGENAAKSTM